MASFSSKCAECVRTNQKDCHAVSCMSLIGRLSGTLFSDSSGVGKHIDSRVERLKNDIRKAQMDAAEVASRTAEVTSRLVRKQKEMDVVIGYYNRKAKHDLDELETEDNERERALVTGETLDEMVDPSLITKDFMTFLKSFCNGALTSDAPVETLQ